MAALYPWLLWLVPLASAPVIFHLCYRLRRQSLPFSSLMFFLRVDPHAQARRRLREILLLALRVLVLLLAILALARPQLIGIGSGGPAAVALLIDTSASMGALTADGRTALAVARAAAASLVDALQPGDSAALVPIVTDPTWALPRGLISDGVALHAGLDVLLPTAANADVPRALASAGRLLAEAAVTRRELHVFTDVQEGEWSQPGTALPGVTVVVHRVAVPTRQTPDVAIRSVQPPLQRVLVGRPARSGVVLSNSGAVAASVAVRITEADGSERLLDATVPAGGEHTVSVVLIPRVAGACTATGQLSGDGFAGNNRAGIALWAEPRMPAVLVGNAVDYALLPPALSPEGDGSHSGLVPTIIQPAALAVMLADPAATPAVVIVTWDQLTTLPNAALQRWVTAGGRLLVVPKPDGQGQPPVGWEWLGAGLGALHDGPGATDMTVLTTNATAWNDLRGDSGSVPVSSAQARRWRPLLPGPGSVAAYGLADGTPLLVEHALGTGLVTLSGLAFHPAWSDLPLKGWSLAVIHAVALPAAGDNQVIRMMAGQGFAASTSERVVHWCLVAGATVWTGKRRDLPPPTQAGAYLLDTMPVAVQAAAHEGEQRYLSGPAVPALGSQTQTVQVIDDPEKIGAAWRDSATGSDLTAWLAAAALLVLVGEGWLATSLGVPRAPRSPSPAGSPAVLLWLPVAPAVVIAAITLLAVMSLVAHYRRLRQRLEPTMARWHVAPRLLITLLLVLLMLGPTLRHEQTAAVNGTVIALVDTSSSMDVVDDGKESRLARVRRLLPELQQALPSGVHVRLLGFDTRVHDQLSATLANGERPGDPAAVLRGLGAEPAVRGALATVVFTDGGDEPFTISAPPATPLSIIGIGTDPTTWRNLAILAVQAPATAEVHLATTITADVAIHLPAAHSQTTSSPVQLEELVAGEWQARAQQIADLHAGRARVTFQQTHDTSGLRRYRVVVPPLAGEVAVSDNQREFAIDVREQTLHVLFFTREIGADYKALRQELARDPGLTFTGLLRTSVMGSAEERYLVQGDRLEGDTLLAGGLPTAVKDLARYGTIILGSFPASAWRAGEQQALVTWVANGGTLIWLGGENAFASGGYGSTPLGALLPWTSDEGLVRGSFPVAVPATAQQLPVVAGVAALLPAGAAVDSRNRLGALSPLARVLLTAVDGGRAVPLLVTQAHGQGTVVAVATNTLWRLARPGQKSAYGTLWRQLVRQQMAGDRERQVRVAWDRERYRPGDTALVTVTALTPGTTLRATLRHAHETATPLAIDEQGHMHLDLGERGEWTLQILNGSEELYAKTQVVAPGLGEGNHLEVDDVTLRAAAQSGGGTYGREADASSVFAQVSAHLSGRCERRERGLMDGWWTAMVITALMVGEWLLRRQRNWL